MDASLSTANTQPDHTALRSTSIPELGVSALLQPRRRLSVGFWLSAAALFLLALCLAAGIAAQRRVQAAAEAIAHVEDNLHAHTATSTGERLATAAERATVSAKQAENVLSTVSIAVLVLGVLVCTATVVAIVLPLRRLTRSVRELADGDLTAPLPRSTLRELDQLALAVNHIGRRLATSERMVRSCYGWDVLTTASSRLRTESALMRACDAGEFLLYYQPQVSLTSMQTSAAEALLRWKLPNGTIVPAAEFFAVAEQCGLIQRLSEWVLARAAESVRDWRRNGWPEARVAVNASAEQFLASNFIGTIESLLRRIDLPPDCLELELTETVLQTGPSTIETLHSLRLLGVSIALDDFGTGYSSLTSLEQLPLNRVKLDRRLIADVDSSPRSAAIVRSIIDLCRSLELQVTAEGVERTSQLDFLRGRGEILVQGFLIAPPVCASQALDFVGRTRKHMMQLCASPLATRGGMGSAAAVAVNESARSNLRVVT